MTAATDKELSALHKKVAQVMIEQLEQQTTAKYLHGALRDMNRDAEPDWALLDQIQEFLRDASLVNPALLQAVTKFLRDNNISAEVEQSAELSELEARLSAKQRRGVNVIPFHE